MPERLFSHEKFRQGMLIAAVLWLYDGMMPAFADAVQEYTAKSVLALNLARYREWPPEAFKANSSAVNLCVLGDEVVQQAFILIDKKPVGSKMLSVHNLNRSKDLNQCQLLYISAETGKTAQWLGESFKRHILTIGEADDFLEQGGMVYLEMTDAKINLHVNVTATQKAGVRISSRVLKLATIFNP